MTPQTKIIALETSGRLGSVALALGPVLLAQRALSASMRHAAELMPTLATLVAEQGWKPNQVEQIYVSLGPGSFTGLRIALSIARAISQATGCKLVGVPSLDVIAQNAPAAAATVAVILDAKRSQVFAAGYRRDSAGTLRRVVGPALVAPGELIARVSADNPSPIHVLGEGVDYHRAALSGTIELPRDLWPARAAAVHALGWRMAERGEFTPADGLLPTYIRLAEAEEVWRKKHNVPL